MTVASGVAMGAEVVAVAVVEDVGACKMLETFIVDAEGDADGEAISGDIDAAGLELWSSFVVNVTGLLEEAVELESFSSTVDMVVVTSAVGSFFAIVGKIEARSVGFVWSSFEVDKLGTMEKVVVRSFAGIETLLVLSLIGKLVPTAVDAKLEVMSLAGIVAAEVESVIIVSFLLGTIVAEVTTTVDVLFMAGVMELVMSLAGVEVKVVRSFVGKVEVGF